MTFTKHFKSKIVYLKTHKRKVINISIWILIFMLIIIGGLSEHSYINLSIRFITSIIQTFLLFFVFRTFKNTIKEIIQEVKSLFGTQKSTKIIYLNKYQYKNCHYNDLK